ncbi:MAG: hypothetical protein M3Z01_05825 [Thermoproteota archaeon]|nr:hypothetical protein [Thermoproteota archaeon]
MTLQMVECKSHDNKILASHEFSNELRELYDLPSINGVEVSINIITNLNGLLKEYADSEESPADVIKDSRENLY